jgi:hypothetical protein
MERSAAVLGLSGLLLTLPCLGCGGDQPQHTSGDGVSTDRDADNPWWLRLQAADNLPKSWLMERVRAEEVEENINPLRNSMESGDELWLYRSPPRTWEQKCGEQGYVIVRKGKPTMKLVTAVN